MVLASGSSVWAQTPSTTTPPAPQPASAPATAQPQAYVDQVIDEKAAQEDKVFAGDSDEAGGGSGLRSLGVDYKYYTVDRADQGVSLEQGVALRYRQETANYGEFFLDSEFRTLDPANGEILVAPRNGGRITLYQNHFALSESLLADNAVGVVRGNSSSLISSTFRRTLPGSLLGGVTSTIYDQDRELRLSLGEIGTLNGIASQQFNTSSGRLAGLGYTSHLGSNWSGGAQFWDLQGNDEVADHQSLALAAEYLTPNNDARYQIHTLLDSKGHNGVWLDGQNQINLWQQRYGVYRLDPGLLWNDVTIANDEQGAYWRADYLSSRYTLSGGLETRENNINDNPVTVGTRTTLGFVSGSRRLSRLNTVGGLFSASDTQQISGPPSNDHQDYVANAYLSHRFGFGLSRFQISRNQTSSDVSPSHTDAFTWDHEWAGLGRLQLSTRLGYERDSTTAGNAGRFTGGLTMRGDLANGLRWDTNVTYDKFNTDGTPSTATGDHNLSASLGAIWAFRPHWEAQAQLITNRTDTPSLAGSPNEENIVFVTLRYQESSGSPLPVQGRQAAGSYGNGSLTGRVFFDENGDGVRQPTEKNASNVTVYLDGRLPVTTDSEGVFQFNLVRTGEHTISIAQEDLPLPWGLLSEAPRKVKVLLRNTAELDIPLVKLNQ